MDIQEIKKQKRLLESMTVDRLLEFQQATGTLIKSIRFTPAVATSFAIDGEGKSLDSIESERLKVEIEISI